MGQTKNCAPANSMRVYDEVLARAHAWAHLRTF
jgi:hypothetical protein